MTAPWKRHGACLLVNWLSSYAPEGIAFLLPRKPTPFDPTGPEFVNIRRRAGKGRPPAAGCR